MAFFSFRAQQTQRNTQRDRERQRRRQTEQGRRAPETGEGRCLEEAVLLLHCSDLLLQALLKGRDGSVSSSLGRVPVFFSCRGPGLVGIGGARTNEAGEAQPRSERIQRNYSAPSADAHGLLDPENRNRINSFQQANWPL